jgi:hypothetical protein
MKKNLVVISGFLFFSLVACSQKMDKSKVPAPVKTAFNTAFPGIVGKWEKENGNFEVNFKKDEKNMSAVIDASGKILETETEITLKELPSGVEVYIKAHYKDAVIKEIAGIIMANGEIVYEAEVNKKDILFDKDGKFIKEARD